MINLTEARTTTLEIAQILENLTPEQKLRAKDILTGISLFPVGAQETNQKTKPS